MKNLSQTDSLTWRKSSLCEGGHCVEVATDGNQIYLRNSQATETVVTFSKEEFAVFAKAVSLGEFDTLAVE